MQTLVREFACFMACATRLALLLAAICCAGCCAPGPILSPSRPNVIVFRAMTGYFPCLREFEERLLDEGVSPTVAFPSAHERIAERLIAAKNNGTLDGPLVIVGYSLGADNAIRVARRLGARGIAVDKLVLLETSTANCVPGNVRECINIYKPQPLNGLVPFFRGCTVTAESSDTVLVNYNVREYNDGRYDWDNHFTLTANPYLQDLMIDEVMTAFETVPEQEGIVSEQGIDDGPVAVETPPPAAG
jgi:pimeloyl-ACP methyl ester carboxylesterase